MKKINLGQKDNIHFVGIGGIGMSGLAQIMKNMGFKVQGSDQNKNKNTISCSKSGIKIFIGHSSNNIRRASIIVKSTAIKNNNIELKQALNLKDYTDLEIFSKLRDLKDTFWPQYSWLGTIERYIAWKLKKGSLCHLQ